MSVLAEVDVGMGRVGVSPGSELIELGKQLARLQHLPQLATAHLLAKAGRPGFEDAAIYAREVRNQIIDFLALNPPRFGVNWLCPMDVGIRVANMLLSVDLLRAGGASFDGAFEAAVAKAAAAHARHILDNLEWSTSSRRCRSAARPAGPRCGRSGSTTRPTSARGRSRTSSSSDLTYSSLRSSSSVALVSRRRFLLRAL